MDDQRTPPPTRQASDASPKPKGKPARTRRQVLELEDLIIEHNLPDRIPVLRAEVDLFRIYFADLIEDALKPPR